MTDPRVIAALRRLLHYRTTARECDCPDWQYRRRQLLQPCKHINLFRDLQPQLEAIKIMPIKGLTTDRQEMLPRIGKIRLGIKKKHSNGREYPAATDYFVCPPEVQAIYGAEPKELTIVLPDRRPRGRRADLVQGVPARARPGLQGRRRNGQPADCRWQGGHRRGGATAGSTAHQRRRKG